MMKESKKTNFSPADERIIYYLIFSQITHLSGYWAMPFVGALEPGLVGVVLA